MTDEELAMKEALSFLGGVEMGIPDVYQIRDLILSVRAEERERCAGVSDRRAALNGCCAQDARTKEEEAECEFRAQEAREIAAAIRESPTPECAHEWVDARNEYVLSGEWCPKCNAIRGGG